MTSPDSINDPARRQATELRNGLLRLHKTLLDSESAFYDRERTRITSRGQLLGLVLNDPWFDWLHRLSELIVSIDEALAGEEPVTRADAGNMIDRTRALLRPSEEGEGFGRRYFDALQRDPAVVLAHGATMKLLSGLAG
jgi:hypothetical protein